MEISQSDAFTLKWAESILWWQLLPEQELLGAVPLTSDWTLSLSPSKLFLTSELKAAVFAYIEMNNLMLMRLTSGLKWQLCWLFWSRLPQCLSLWINMGMYQGILLPKWLLSHESLCKCPIKLCLLKSCFFSWRKDSYFLKKLPWSVCVSCKHNWTLAGHFAPY